MSVGPLNLGAFSTFQTTIHGKRQSFPSSPPKKLTGRSWGGDNISSYLYVRQQQY